MRYDFLETLGVQKVNCGFTHQGSIALFGREELVSINPATGLPIAKVIVAGSADYERVICEAESAFKKWRLVPAPKRGEIIREFSEELRIYKNELGKLVSLEMGKIVAEGVGEIQEMIDMCDYAVGLSRQLYGVTTYSERFQHRMYEQWHSLGVVGVITSFNFPVAVWAWNAVLAAVCGDTVVWKPSSETPLCAIAVQKICDRVMGRHDFKSVFNLVIGSGKTVGDKLVRDTRIPLISFTG